jgi:hypothetical protein
VFIQQLKESWQKGLSLTCKVYFEWPWHNDPEWPLSESYLLIVLFVRHEVNNTSNVIIIQKANTNMIVGERGSQTNTKVRSGAYRRSKHPLLIGHTRRASSVESTRRYTHHKQVKVVYNHIEKESWHLINTHFYGCYNDLVCNYKLSLAHMLNDLFHRLC